MIWFRCAGRPVSYALLAALLAFCWQALTVHYNYGGNWTGLFCTGARFIAPPAALDSEHIYRFRNADGYDGQMYHYMAHDPFLTRGFQSAMDSPRVRYHRILVPFAAWLMAGGRDQLIDIAYYALILLSVFAGALWAARIADQSGAHPAWALSFLFIPGVAVSIDRMTIDASLIALTAGFVYYSGNGRWPAVFLLCALAGLARESGLLLTAGVVAWFAIHRRWERAFAFALSAAPAVAWYAYVNARTPASPSDVLSFIPFAGILTRLATPVHYPFGVAMNALTGVLDYAALAGIVVAVVYCAANRRRLAKEPDGLVAFAFVALAAWLSWRPVWEEAYAFARVYSPLILLLALDGLRARSFLGALPLILTAPGIGLEMGGQVLGIARGLTGL